MGSLRQREVILDALRDLPQARIAGDQTFGFIGRYALFGPGIGYRCAFSGANRLTPGVSL